MYIIQRLYFIIIKQIKCIGFFFGVPSQELSSILLDRITKVYIK